MKFKSYLLWISLSAFLFYACSDPYERNTTDGSINDDTEQNENQNNPEEPTTSVNTAIKILSLGDSYTVGENVCATCRFPEQLKDRLRARLSSASSIDLKLIARTGWTTTSLIDAINTDNQSNFYDLVTLLIGVNNQYRNVSFSVYEKEFPLLVNTAIAKAKSTKSKVIVLSIPDYAFTPFGRGNTDISKDIDKYNAFAENYCLQNGVSFVNITDITRQGLANPKLVTFDGLHPSELAYSKFVDRITPLALEQLKN